MPLVTPLGAEHDLETKKLAEIEFVTDTDEEIEAITEPEVEYTFMADGVIMN